MISLVDRRPIANHAPFRMLASAGVVCASARHEEAVMAVSRSVQEFLRGSEIAYTVLPTSGCVHRETGSRRDGRAGAQLGKGGDRFR